MDKKIVMRDWDFYDLNEDSKLDKYALDIEAEKQAHLMHKWISLLAQAQDNLSIAKERLAYQESKLLLKAKTGEVIKLGSKPTDAVAKAWVRIQPEIKKAIRNKRKAEKDVKYLQDAKTVLEHKRAAIKIEAELWITGYFSRPRSKGITKKEEEAQKLSQAQALKESMKKRKKRKANLKNKA